MLGPQSSRRRHRSKDSGSVGAPHRICDPPMSDMCVALHAGPGRVRGRPEDQPHRDRVTDEDSPVLGGARQDAVDELRPASRRVVVAVVAKPGVPRVTVDDGPLNATVGIHPERSTTAHGKGVARGSLRVSRERVIRPAAPTQHRANRDSRRDQTKAWAHKMECRWCSGFPSSNRPVSPPIRRPRPSSCSCAQFPFTSRSSYHGDVPPARMVAGPGSLPCLQ